MLNDPGIAFVHDTLQNAEVLHVFGELDLSNAEDLEAAISEIRLARCVVIDLSECTYADSSTLSVLVRAARSLGNGLYLVVTEGAVVDRLLRISGIATLLQIRRTLDEAAAAAA